jgi:hypothetical protein
MRGSAPLSDGGAASSSAERRRVVRRELERLEPAFRIVAEDVLALSTRIDLVAIDRRRRVAAVTIAGAGRDGSELATALAHRRWLADHVPDWLKIAPDLGFDPAAPIRSLLVAPEFDAETLAAAAVLPDGWIELLRAIEAGRGDDRRTWLEPVPRPGSAPHPPAGTDGRGARLPQFRSGLSPEDLSLSDDERAHFD